MHAEHADASRERMTQELSLVAMVQDSSPSTSTGWRVAAYGVGVVAVAGAGYLAYRWLNSEVQGVGPHRAPSSRGPSGPILLMGPPLRR